MTVTFPDGSTGSVTVDAQGNFGPVTSLTPQTNGSLTLGQTDPAGNISPSTTQSYTDDAAPVAPAFTSVSPNSDGTVSVSGRGEAGSVVTVTFPDGSTGSVTVDAQGNFGPVISDTPQTNGTLTLGQTDPAGNISPSTTQSYTDETAPVAPAFTAVTS